MKRLFFYACMALTVSACNNSAEDKNTPAGDSATKATTAAPTEKLDYPYTLSEPYKNWQPGNQQHAITIMKGLKAFETGDVATCVTSFGDSVMVMFDGYRAKLSNDSLKKQFMAERGNYSSMTIKMEDWESVISSDKKEEWVTLWYKQITTDKKGKTDSVDVVDDAKIENGKVVLLSEKIQHYPAKK